MNQNFDGNNWHGNFYVCNLSLKYTPKSKPTITEHFYGIRRASNKYYVTRPNSVCIPKTRIVACNNNNAIK